MREPDPCVASPCVRKCCLDDDDVCLGCGRSIQEIMDWNITQSAERLDIIARSKLRIQGRRDPLDDNT
jgi:predicted Fe-S protein YdhL (DUF1289 family)